MAKKNKMTQIMALLALFWIIIWIVGTGLLIIFSGNNTSTEETITAEQYLELQKLIEAQSWAIIEDTVVETLTWETK